MNVKTVLLRPSFKTKHAGATFISPEESARILNARLHRDHTDWIVKRTADGTFIEIQYQLEDYSYKFTPFEAEAITMAYLKLEESEHDVM